MSEVPLQGMGVGGVRVTGWLGGAVSLFLPSLFLGGREGHCTGAPRS